MIYCPVCRQEMISRPRYVCEICWQNEPERCIMAIAVERDKTRQAEIDRLNNEASPPATPALLRSYLEELNQPKDLHDYHYRKGQKVLKKVGREFMRALDRVVTSIAIAVTSLVVIPFYCLIALIGYLTPSEED